MWPLCSSTRATPLKIITTARLSVHTLMGSKEVFRTKTLPFILGLILRERGRGCQKDVAGEGVGGPLNVGNKQVKEIEQAKSRTSQEGWLAPAGRESGGKPPFLTCYIPSVSYLAAML